MKTLILMRHAKSSWGNPTLADHARPLNDRGIYSARALAKWLREKKLTPSQALVSSSVRTQETFAGLKLDIEPTLKPELYHASSDTLLETIESAEEDTIILIAHNPGIGDLAMRLARMMGQHPSHSRFADYPTGATLVTQWEADSWHDIDWSQGKMIDFIVPRDLLL
jgi:phosphohistidine phosphatase